MVWQIEYIPDEDNLYYRVHIDQMDLEQGLNFISIKVFTSRNGSMSTDWDKYSSPEDSRNRATEPNKNRVLRINIGEVRLIPMTVIHEPDEVRNNRAHTKVLGLENINRQDRNEIRIKLSDIALWVNNWILLD